MKATTAYKELNRISRPQSGHERSAARRGRHRREVEATRTTVPIDIGRVRSALFLPDSPQPAYSPSTLPPREVTEGLAATWLMVMEAAGRETAECADRALRGLPSDVATAVAAVLSAATLRMTQYLDWGYIEAGFVELTRLRHLQADLAGYGKHTASETVFNVLAGALQALPERGRQEIDAGLTSQAEALLVGYRLGRLLEHIDTSGDIAAGRLLHDAGGLVMHYRHSTLGRQADAELCLSFRSDCGFLSFLPDPSGGLGLLVSPGGTGTYEAAASSGALSPAAVRSMRRFVTGYRGVPMDGEISPHTRAARLCSLIGLEVREGRGYLRGAGR